MKVFKTASLIMIGTFAAVGSVYAAQAPEDPEPEALASWRAAMAQNPMPGEGCFHASYPDLVWETLECKTEQPRVHPVRAKATDPVPDVVGNKNDYVANAKGLITLATGGFAIKGVTSEQTVNVPFDGGESSGVTGTNEFSVQINTNKLLSSPACNGHSKCTVWQQFLYSTDYDVSGEAAVYMQYWLINYGPSCPKGWNPESGDCFKNSNQVAAPDIPITDLGKVLLQAAASPGGVDSVTLQYGSELYSHTVTDSVLDISSVWNKAEFNVVGDGGGSRADFNSGSSITVKLELVDGSTAAPTCIADDGTTGETNNLDLSTCAASGGLPSINFSESN
jgi:hypothetical protein